MNVNYDFADHEHTIPLPATLVNVLGDRINEEFPGTDIRLYSRFPFPHRKQTEQYDEFELDAIAQLERDPESPVHTVVEEGGRLVVRYAIADRMRASCIGCHNAHPESPKTDWRTGDVRGVLVINLPLNTISAQTSDDLRKTSISYAGVAIGIAAILAIVIIRLGRQSEELSRRVKERTTELETEILRRQKTEERFRQAIEAAPAAMIMVDREGIVAHANHEAAELFGFTVGKLVGQKIEVLVPDDKRADHPLNRENYVENPVVRRMGGLDLLAQKKQGEIFPVEIRLNPIDTPDGIVVLCSVVDLTERKKSMNVIIDQAKELEAANDLLEQQATTDGLTNIANRRSWNYHLETMLKLSERYNHPVSILLADVDHFKKFNDDLGHPAGDRALAATAQTLQDASRGTDLVARYGGEEFAVLLPETDHDDALFAAEKLRQAVEAISGLDRGITISIGVSTLLSEQNEPFDLETIEKQLLEEADKALYRSKESGRNRVTHFDDMDDGK